MKSAVDDNIHALLQERLLRSEKHLNFEILTYYGPFEGYEIEQAKDHTIALLKKLMKYRNMHIGIYTDAV